MFKNETHNHPPVDLLEAATCLGGAVRDPLSGRAYVYQAMRAGCETIKPIARHCRKNYQQVI